ncbi:MAG: DUF4842 domain-containing protein [Bacteroidales bacterium]|nr:DUF4842 domain-containing protein [Bacteroidales bacterium]
MRKFLLISSSVLAMAMLASSCNKGPEPYVPQPVEDAFADAIPTGYYSYAEISVPAGTQTVYVHYKGEDGSEQTIPQSVKPIVAEPKDGKDVEPFGTVKLLFQAKVPSKVSVSYVLNEATKAGGGNEIPVLTDVPVDQVTSGAFGKTRYVQVQRNYAWMNNASTGWKETPTYPADVVIYDEQHNHTLRYTYAYSGVKGEGYMLTDAYEVVDHVAVSYKYNYCGGCEGCQFCMPWGCSCGCGHENPDFIGNGDGTGSASPSDIVPDPANPGTYPTPDGEGNYKVGEDGSLEDVDYTPDEAFKVELDEPESYKTTDEDYTVYHSSGVVMFDDKWPKMPDAKGGKYNLDFNDLVVDYDIEAVTVSDERLAIDHEKEQVKVVLHVRAIGGDDIWRVGVALENFNTDYVKEIKEYHTLDSYQNPHGDLPAWIQEKRFWENSIHYDAVSGTEFTRNTNRPAIEIGQLQAFNGKKWDQVAGKDVYQHKDDHGNVTDHVMNPALRLWSGWPEPDKSQYDPELENVKEPYSFAQLSSKTFYNTVPGYVNVDGGLYTYTVIYKMKPRSEMNPKDREAAKQNMIDAVMNTLAQNFFVVKKDYTPIGLKGYQPLDYRTKDNHCYADEYAKNLEANLDHLNPDVPYVATNGQVWAFKAPVKTRHVWEMTFFANAYPHYHEWAESNGTEATDWYKRDLNYTYITCWW